MSLTTYAADKVAIIIGGLPVVGKGADTFISIEVADDDWTESVGADGSVVRSLKANNLATATLTLQQTSPINDFLSGKLFADRQLPGAGLFSLTVKDLLGTSTFFSGTAYVKKQATMEFAHESTEREWTISLVDFVSVIGGTIPNLPTI